MRFNNQQVISNVFRTVKFPDEYFQDWSSIKKKLLLFGTQSIFEKTWVIEERYIPLCQQGIRRRGIISVPSP